MLLCSGWPAGFLHIVISKQDAVDNNKYAKTLIITVKHTLWQHVLGFCTTLFNDKKLLGWVGVSSLHRLTYMYLEMCRMCWCGYWLHMSLFEIPPYMRCHVMKKVWLLSHLHDIAMPSTGERGVPPAFLHLTVCLDFTWQSRLIFDIWYRSVKLSLHLEFWKTYIHSLQCPLWS